MSSKLTFVKKKFVNTSDVDIYVKDFSGREYILFPKEEKEVIVMVNRRKQDGQQCIGNSSPS